MATATYSFRLTAEGFQAFAKDLEAVGNSSESARRSVETLIRSSPQLAGALDKAMVAADRARASMTTAATATQAAANQNERAVTSFGRNTSQAFTQAGYQINDFIVQLQSGGNAFVAFSQQGSQLAGALAGGMAGLAVAVAGIAAQFIYAAVTSGDAAKAQITYAEAIERSNELLLTADERSRRVSEAKRQETRDTLALAIAVERENLARINEQSNRLQQAQANPGSAAEALLRSGTGARAPILRDMATQAEAVGQRIADLEARIAGLNAQSKRETSASENDPPMPKPKPLDTTRSTGGALRTAAEEAQRFEDSVLKGMQQAQREADKVRNAYQQVAGALDPAIAAQQRYNDQIRALDAALQQGFISQERYAELVGKAQNQLAASGDKFEKAFDQFFSKSASSFEQAIVAGGSLRDVFKGLEKDIATVILRMTILEPLMSSIRTAYRSAGGIDGIFGSLFGSGTSNAGIATSAAETSGFLYHSGGVVGAGGTQRRVPNLAFAGAPRFHMGVDEVPAILKRGERVLTREQAAANDRSTVYSPTINVNVRDSNASAARIAAAVGIAVQQSKEAVAMEADRGGRYAQRVGRRA